MARGNQRGGQGGILLPQKSAKAIETRDEIAKAAGVSHDTIAKVEKKVYRFLKNLIPRKNVSRKNSPIQISGEGAIRTSSSEQQHINYLHGISSLCMYSC